MITELFPIPIWALNYLVDGYNTGLEPDDVEMIQEWIYDNEILDVIAPDDLTDDYFSDLPSFGPACNVIDCECVLEW